MNPTSTGTPSPGHTLFPNLSPSLRGQELEHVALSDQAEWHVEGPFILPIYSQYENELFKQAFHEQVKKISLQLQAMMAYVLEISPNKIGTVWEAFSQLVSCLGNNLPTQIPLSIFTSAVAVTCVTNIEHDPPAKKRKRSGSSEESELRNQLLEEAQRLASTIHSTLSFLKVGVQLNQLKEKNPGSHQSHCAFQHAISKRLSVGCSVVLDLSNEELAERIISSIDAQWDMCSYEAKDQLLRSAMHEFIRMQDTLISDAYTGLAHRKKGLSLTGKRLLAICKEASASDISPSANMEGWPSWEDRSFCFLARFFLQKNNFIVPHQTDVQSLLTALEPYLLLLSTFPTKISVHAKMNRIVENLVKWFVQVSLAQPAEDIPKTFERIPIYNDFLQCSTSIASLLKGFFMLETNMPFSLQTLTEFQKYAHTLHLSNTTEAMNNAVQEVASICSEEHQTTCSSTKLLLEKTYKLLEQFMFQSVAAMRKGNRNYKNKSFPDIPYCEWIPDELRLSRLFCNVWKEAIWAHPSGMPLREVDREALNCSLPELKTTSEKFQGAFLKLCNNLLINVLEEVTPGNSENVLEGFFSSARALQAKTITKHEPASHLFLIGINFITTSERFVLRNSLLARAKQEFTEAQTACVAHTYSFIFQQENYIPKTQKTFLQYCKEQYKGTMSVPEHLEQLPSWNTCIFFHLVQVFLQKKQKPIPIIKDIRDGFNAVKNYLFKRSSRTAPAKAKLMFFIEALAEMIFLLNQEPINAAEQMQSAPIMYDDTVYESVLQSVASFNKLMHALFKLDTGKTFSKSNRKEFQNYINDLLLYTENPTTKELLLGSLAVCMADSQTLNVAQKYTSDSLAQISGLIKKLIDEALSLVTLNKPLMYQCLTPEITVLSAFHAICSDGCIPRRLLCSQEMLLLWEETRKKPSEEMSLSQIERTSKMYPETASELTRCFLKLCQMLLVEISNEWLLEPTPSRFIQRKEQTQEQKFIQKSFNLFPKAIVTPDCNQSILFKEIVSFLAEDKFFYDCAECLTLATENFLTAKKTFAFSTYSHLIKQKLPLPLTGKDLLLFCKNQYGSSTSIPESLATLPSWDNSIFSSLAQIFLLSKGQQITSAFQSCNALHLIDSIVPFFLEQAKELIQLPQTIQIKEFIKHLVQHFSSSRSLETPEKEPAITEIDPYLCRAYENFLESANLLRTFFRMLFQLKAGKDYSSQYRPEFNAYIASILVNEPDLRRTSTLQDVAIICSENNETLEQKRIWADFHHASFLLQTLLEVSLALMLFCVTIDTELTPQQTVDIALQTTSSITLLPLTLGALPKAFLASLAGTHALKNSMDAYVAGSLCIQLFEQSQLVLQGTETNPLQAAIDAHVSGQVSPQVSAYKHSLSSVFLSTKEALENVCKTLYTALKADIMPAISKEPSLETPSEKFITTANNTHKKMMAEKPLEVPLFQSLVLILAQEYDDDLQTRSAASSDQFMRTQPETSAAEEPENDVNTSMWKNIIGVLLEEEQQAIRDKENLSAIVQTTGTGEALPELLQEEDFTNLLEEAGDFTDFLEQSGDFTDFLEQDFSFEEETEEDPAS